MDNSKIKMTVSIGVAQYTNPKESLADVLKQADKALYQAKKLGKNQVVITT